MHLCLSMAVNSSLQCCYLQSRHSREPDPNSPLCISTDSQIICPFQSVRCMRRACPRSGAPWGAGRRSKSIAGGTEAPGSASTRRVNRLTCTESCQTKRWPGASSFPLCLHCQAPASTCQLRQAGSGGERAGVDWQRVPDGTAPAGAVLAGQKDAATLPWKWSAVFRLRASTVSSVSAHSKTSLRPYKCVLWHRALNAFCRIKRKKK